MASNNRLALKEKFNISNIVSLVVLGPVFFAVFSWCPFKMPYIYCVICPVRCAWYRIRGYMFLLALGLNMRRNLFCARICPVGTVQIFLSKITKKKVAMPGSLLSAKYLSVFLLAFIIIFTFNSPSINYTLFGLSLGQIFISKMKYILLAIFSLSIITSIFVYRFFCYSLCPVRALSTVLHTIKPKQKEKGDSGARVR